MVAGLSSRFGLGLKQLAKIGPNNETLIEISVNQALKMPFKKLIFITNPKTEDYFKEIFNNNYKNTPVSYIQQKYDEKLRDKPWGTTDAICSLRGYVNNPFIVVNSDDIYGEKAFKDGYKFMEKSNTNIIAGLNLEKSLPEDNTLANRGVIEIDQNNFVTNVKEVLNISRKRNINLFHKIANVNFLGLTPETLYYLDKELILFKEKNKLNRKIESNISDF